MCIYLVVSSLHLRKKMQTAVHLRENIWLSEYAETPFIFGIVKPRIYIPYRLGDDAYRYVLAHERVHLSRKDHWAKAAAFLILCAYWFHPLVWISYGLFCRDIELSCDEAVILKLSNEEKKAYAYALLHCGGKQHVFTACPLSFGEVGVKERVLRIKTYKKPAVWVVPAALAVCIGVAVCFFTSPAADAEHVTGDGTSAAAAQDENALTLDMVLDMTENQTFAGQNFLSFSNAQVEESDGISLNYYAIFDFEYGGDVIRLYVSMMTEDDALERVYLRRESDGEMKTLYDADETFAKYAAKDTAEVEEFLNAVCNIHNVLSYELPDGLTESAYHADIGFGGGCVFEPDAYEIPEEADSLVPAEWKAAGMVSRYAAEEVLRFNDDGTEIVSVTASLNHSSMEPLGAVDGLCAPAYLVKGTHDLYTAADSGDAGNSADADGTVTETDGSKAARSDAEKTSEYWYVFFAKPDDETGYCVSLNAKNFTKEEALAFAKTVTWVQ